MARRFPHDLGVYGTPGDVSPWDIRFDPADRAHLEPVGSGRFRFRVWGEPGLGNGLVVVRDGEGTVTGHPMEVVAATIRFGFFEAVVGPFCGRVEYSFAFRNAAGHPVYLAPSGVTNAVERLDRWTLDPALPAVGVPEWAKGAVIYQIFPDRFAKGDGSTDPPGTDPWGSPPHSRRFQGGDLVGVADRLDYLAGLGVDAIYLNPIFTSPSNHRYDAIDYSSVDPALGGDAALERLVGEAHRRGMRVILDASFNHVHPRFFAFADLVRRGRRSRYRDWFVVRDWPPRLLYRPHATRSTPWVREWIPVWEEQVGVPVEVVDGPGRAVEPTYEAWYSVPTMPRVNLANPEARAYMLGVAAHWVAEHGIDGWRMDVARYVDPDFWNDFRRVVKAADPEAYLLCEVMGDAGDWLQGDRFDATMNYTFRDLALRFFARDEIDGAALLDDAARLIAQYPWAVTLVNQNLIGSHDTPRFLSEAGGDVWRLRLATVFQLTFPGAPGIYYGDEVAMTGGDDPGSRGAFPWEIAGGGHDLQETIRRLAALRRSEPALVTGDWRPVHGAGGLVAFERRLGRRRVLVAINRSGRPARVPAGPGWRRLLWGSGRVEGGEVVVGARSAVLAGR